MTKLTDLLVPNSDRIAAKIIDGETIIMNVRNGFYYSMDGAGSIVWQAVEQRKNLGQIIAAVSSLYDVSLEMAEKDILALAEQLIAEEIVVKVEDTGRVVIEDLQVVAAGTNKLDYIQPQLVVCRDMSDLLALDPPAPGVGDLKWED